MRDTDYELKELYSKKVASLKCERKDEIMKLFKETERTKAGKRINAFHIALAVMTCVLVIGVGVIGAKAAGLDLAEVIFNKTEDTTLTDQEKMDLANDLESLYANDVTSEDIEHLEGLDDLQTNEDGTTYGAMELGAELVAVEADDGTIGYFYQSDYDEMNGSNLNSPEEHAAYSLAVSNGTARNWIYVYEEDGVTIIGKYILSPSFDSNNPAWPEGIEIGDPEWMAIHDEWYAENYGEGTKYDFVTNEELEDEIVQAELINGTDYEDYEDMVTERAEALAD